MIEDADDYLDALLGPSRTGSSLKDLAQASAPRFRQVRAPKRREMFALSCAGLRGQTYVLTHRMQWFFACDRLVADDTSGGHRTRTTLRYGGQQIIAAIPTRALGRESTLELLQAVRVARTSGLVEEEAALRAILRTHPATDLAQLDALLERIPREKILPTMNGGMDVTFEIEFLEDANWHVWCRGWALPS